MRLAIALLLIVLAIPAYAQDVLLEEGFESAFDGTGWIAAEGSWSLGTSVFRTGQSSLRLTDPADYYVTYDLVTPMTDTIMEVWFYDDLTKVYDTHVGITGAADYLTSTNGHLLIGTDCVYSPNNYCITEGWHSTGFFALGPPRSLGWHSVEFKNQNGINFCYLDGLLLHTTSFQGQWSKVVLMENNKCTWGSSWFDDLVVYQLGAVPASSGSWGMLKAKY